ncbi:MAG: ATP-dependent protease subunit HslV [Candidatus Marinimicrobia bacterium]|jgi:ATP-dependent HslUV protease subunit HslV|nr:ATP-dependent protease subunit HslV [Candidatus Neomarinimicrobiota bacterium]MDD4961763.1 ATP-dependent protease subunit HslV [Candidatus Neomarinimicrobiota bacterium]MDD5709922.1 ATP-dependent protease subunit HslV [Candidatus Neomarinimicrobiota bacterium]MDX9778306.1 ATP-dependent protease subunit HslV [bacterium]
MEKIKSTTILGIHRNGRAAIAGDGQVTLGNTVMKAQTVKVRKLYNGQILAGFAGAGADAFSLFEKFESKIKEYKGDLTRAAVELTKEWRRDKYLQKLEALLIVMDKDKGYILSGSGDVIDADDHIYAIGSGGPYALAAARALMENSKLSAAEIAEKSLKIAGSICIFTNQHITVMELDT